MCKNKIGTEYCKRREQGWTNLDAMQSSKLKNPWSAQVIALTKYAKQTITGSLPIIWLHYWLVCVTLELLHCMDKLVSIKPRDTFFVRKSKRPLQQKAEKFVKNTCFVQSMQKFNTTIVKRQIKIMWYKLFKQCQRH